MRRCYSCDRLTADVYCSPRMPRPVALCPEHMPTIPRPKPAITVEIPIIECSKLQGRVVCEGNCRLHGCSMDVGCFCI